jgi:hypothetical protein
MSRYINGPVNFAILQGKVNGINKKLYIFMDRHDDLQNQTRCESFDSIDIAQYLYKKIIETKEPLDFFMEIRKEQIEMTKSNKNVRLHYLDIRDRLGLMGLKTKISFELLKDYNLLIDKKLLDTSSLINNLTIIYKYMKKVEDILLEIENNNKIYDQDTIIYIF